MRSLLKKQSTGEIFCVDVSMQEINERLHGTVDWLVSHVPSDSPFKPQSLDDVIRGFGVPVRSQWGSFVRIVDPCRNARPIIAEFKSRGIHAFIADIQFTKQRVMVNAESLQQFSFENELAYDLGDRFAMSVYVALCKE